MKIKQYVAIQMFRSAFATTALSMNDHRYSHGGEFKAVVINLAHIEDILREHLGGCAVYET